MVLALLVFVQFASAKVQKPEEFLGFKVGEDRKIADMHQIVDYFRMLDKESGRITVKEVGKTTEGNPFIATIITSEGNHKNLEKYRNYQQMLADPRKITDLEAEKIISDGKTVVMINCAIHATEVGAAQMSMELAYNLGTQNDKKTKEILDNVILILIPLHNPDGAQMVADWYKKNLGTEYEGSRMPWLYQKYVGHDNNRDWYMFTQAETQLTIEVHNAWHPQVVMDMHQMGSSGARLFVPPYVDPYEPNVDPILRQQVAMMGTFIASELTSQGKGGVIHSSGYDAWTPARAYHHYHGGIRILTEAASVRIATPITIKFESLRSNVREPSVSMPLPWKGGEWKLRDIVDYDYAAAEAALTNAARLRENWIRNFYRIHKKAVTGDKNPFAFIVPSEQKSLSAAIKMMQILNMGGVEIHRTRASFQADGGQYPTGTYLVYMAQPYGGYAKALLEKQVYPEIREFPGGPLKTPYDVVAHTLPLLMGVEAIQAEKPFQVKAELLSRIDKPKGTVETVNDAYGYLWGHETNDDMITLNRLVKKGYEVFWSAEKFAASGKSHPAGTMIVRQKEGLVQDLHAIVKDLWVHLKPLREKPEIKAYRLKPVRLGLYKSWTASMDEGWTRWVLEQNEFSYKSILDKDIRKGGLNQDFDVIIIPDLRANAIIKGISENVIPPEYSGGIGEVGVKNLKEFTQNGGALITLNSAAEFPIEQFHLAVENSVEKLERKSFFIPGSLLKALKNVEHPIAYGYGRDTAIFFRRSPVFTIKEGKSVLSYPVHGLLSGWVNGEEYLFGKSALVDVSFGQGRVILIGFPVLYRAQTHGTFRLLFNSIYYGAAAKVNLN